MIPFFSIATALLTRSVLAREKPNASASRKAGAPPIPRHRPPPQRTASSLAHPMPIPKPYLVWSSAWPKAQKPALHLMSMTGDVQKDLQVIGVLYKELTGKGPTPEEVARARLELEAQPQK